MQHIVHIFIGNELVSFRDQFAADFRKGHSDLEKSLFTALTLVKEDDAKYILTPDEKGDRQDGAIIDGINRGNDLVNFLEGLYSRKVTVVNPGNQSMVVMIWAELFQDNVDQILQELIESIGSCTSNFKTEVTGFTNDSVSCFMPNPESRLDPATYKKNFDSNVAALRSLRPSLSALRLVADRNMDNVGLGLSEASMALVCAEYSALMCRHYLRVHPSVINSQEYPFETFGVSSVIFDIAYYKAYIRDRIIIDKLKGEGIDDRWFNINSLASDTNPVLNETREEIHSFYGTQVAHAKAELALRGRSSSSSLVGAIDKDIKEIVNRLRNKIDSLLSGGKISIFEREALMALILGDDCSMFESSVVNANETTIEDIIDESVRFFVDLDSDQEILKDISQAKIKEVRNSMRNIAVANRKREERLNAIKQEQKESFSHRHHIRGNEYQFGDTGYKLNLNIDTEQLEQVYEPHDVKEKNIDFRNRFGPIRNQGKQGSCASFAVTSVIEALSGGGVQYSPAFLYWNARESTKTTTEDSGASLNDIIKAATQRGVCREESMPYIVDRYNVAPSEVAIKEGVECRILEAKSVNPNLGDIKSALSDGFPVIVAAKIFDSFSDTQGGFVRLPSKDERMGTGRTDGHGAHAMVVCGFSDAERIFVVRNSWGKDFGDKGYCYIPYSYAQEYFMQACIITSLSNSKRTSISEKRTINFNMSDSNIEAAVIQNLIGEDIYKLNMLAEESTNLKTGWTQNLGLLENVNNQAAIIKKAKAELDEEIKAEKDIIEELQASKNAKLDEYIQRYIKGVLWSGGIGFVFWFATYHLYGLTDIYTWTMGVAIVATLICLGLVAAFGYQWRKYRQDLRDEIQEHANIISKIEAEKASLDIKAHIHGTILREIDDLRSELRTRHRMNKEFDDAWVRLYEDTKREYEGMSPTVPYPFMAVLDNNLLDKYYQAWKGKMLESIDFDSLYQSFTRNQDLVRIVGEDASLNGAVVRGLKNFSMREYVTMRNNAKWQFLPDSSRMSELFPDMDYRAKPFCPYTQQIDNNMEKYIFVKDLSQEELRGILNYFSQPPMLIEDTNPYSISVLNVVRYNL